jgi:hypothetical protein
MAEQSFDTRGMTRDQASRIASATAIGLNAVKPILQFQVSLLRLWADNIETSARNYETGLAAEIEQQGQQRRAT